MMTVCAPFSWAARVLRITGGMLGVFAPRRLTLVGDSPAATATRLPVQRWRRSSTIRLQRCRETASCPTPG